MASQYYDPEDSRSHQERRIIWGRRGPMARRKGATVPWRVEIVVVNDREFVATRSLLDRRRVSASDRRNYMERRASSSFSRDESLLRFEWAD